MASLSVKILTPSGSVFNDESTMVVLPGVTGEFGILPGHVSMIFRLDPGMITLHSNGHAEYKMFIFGGFAKVNDDQLYILVDRVCKLEDLDHEEAKQNLEDLEKKMFVNTNLKLLDLLELKIRTARKILQLSKPKH
jgi:F-type H+-transporting ATPase subunit epsilon